MSKRDGLFRPKYRDKRTGALRTARVWWMRDPATGKRVSTGCEDLDAARAVRRHHERLAHDEAYRAAHNATLGHWAGEVLKDKRARKSEGTVDMYEVKLRHILRLFGENSPLVSVTPRSVDEYIRTREAEGAAASTISKELTALVQICKYARRAGSFSGDVAALRPVGFSVGYTPRERHATWGELDKLKAALPAKRWAMVAFIVATSARLSEALRARPEDYDRRRKVIRIRGTKTAEAAAEIPVVSIFKPLLDEAIQHAPFDWQEISSHLPRACAKAGIPALTPNDLRRTTASILVAEGVKPSMIARILRHKDSRMVERVYGRASAEEIGAVIEAEIAAHDFDVIRPNESEPGEHTDPETTENAEETEGAGDGDADPAGFKILRSKEHLGSTPRGATQQKKASSDDEDGEGDGDAEPPDFDVILSADEDAADFAIALAEHAARAGAFRVLDEHRVLSRLPAVVRVGLFRREREAAEALGLTAGGGHAG